MTRTHDIRLLCTVIPIYLCISHTLASNGCGEPVIHYNGSVLIGGLFDIHEEGTEVGRCGVGINKDAIQRMEAFLFAVGQLNEKNQVPGITFGE